MTGRVQVIKRARYVTGRVQVIKRARHVTHRGYGLLGGVEKVAYEAVRQEVVYEVCPGGGRGERQRLGPVALEEQVSRTAASPGRVSLVTRASHSVAGRVTHALHSQ